MVKLSAKEKEAQFRKQMICDAAWEVFDAKGFINATMQDIAERSEYALGTIYKSFKSKEEIIVSLVEQKLDELNQVIQELFDSFDNMNPLKKLQGLLEKMFDYFVENRKILQIMTIQRWASDFNLIKKVQKECADTSERLHKQFFGLIEEGIEKGYFRKVDPYKTHLVIGGIFMDLFWDQMLADKISDTKSFADDVMSFLIYGIGNPDRNQNEQER